MPDLEAIVFDCDGVILESADLKSQAFFKIGAQFGPDVQKSFYEYHMSHTGVSRFEKFAWLYRTHLGREISPDESARLGAMFVEIATEAVRRAPFVPGFQEVLAYLDGRLPLFVASGTPQEELCHTLEERGIFAKFKAVLGTPPSKNELLARILAENAFDPQRVIMVGDGETDLKAAQANGTLFYGRGGMFQGRGLPWSGDLMGFKEYLRKLPITVNRLTR